MTTSIVGMLADDADTMVSVMKFDETPHHCSTQLILSREPRLELEIGFLGSSESQSQTLISSSFALFKERIRLKILH